MFSSAATQTPTASFNLLLCTITTLSLSKRKEIEAFGIADETALQHKSYSSAIPKSQKKEKRITLMSLGFLTENDRLSLSAQ
jgi:hypothetical protein